MADAQLPSWVQGILPPESPFRSAAPPSAGAAPRQAAQPPLAVSHDPPPAFVGPEESPAPPSPWQKAQTIGAPEMGEHYPLASLPEILASDSPLKLFAEYVLGGNARPRSLANADPIGINTFTAGKGPMPMIGGPIEEVGGAARDAVQSVGRGLFSRVDDVAAQLPAKGVHPNKLASLLKSGASSEEVAYRKIPEFLAAQGDRPVTPEALQAHLAANPAPMPQTTVLGDPNAGLLSYEQWRREWGDINDPTVTEGDMRRGYDDYRAHAARLPGAGATKYQAYSLPGGEQYREHLYTLPDRGAADRAAIETRRASLEAQARVLRNELDAGNTGAQSRWERDQLISQHMDVQEELRKLAAPPEPTGYRSGHFDQPNILAHARTTERTLPAPTALPENYAVHQDRDYGAFYYQRPEGGGSAQDYPTAEAATRAAMEHAGVQPSRGRFIEEIQSDWHQAGKRQGYATPLPPDAQARLAQLPQEIASAQHMVSGHNQQLKAASDAYLDALKAATRPHLPPEYQDLTSFGEASRSGEPAVRAWRTARERGMQTDTTLSALRTEEEVAQQRLNSAVNRLSALQEEHGQLLKPSGVPDAPFKDTWPDLALKQQLLDVARDPHANWLGFTSGKTQAARYDLSKQVSRLSFEPDTAHDFSVGSLVAHDHQGHEVLREQVEPHQFDDYVGKEPADNLRRQIAEHEQARDYERAQWSVEQDPDIPNRFYIHDPNGEPMHDYAGRLERFRSEEDAHARIDDLLRADQEQHGVPPSISGLDLQVGGEGMHHFYDQLLPARLRKLLKPFGGTVEPFELPTTKQTMDIDVPAFSVRDQAGNMRGIWENRADAEAYLANPPDFIDPTRSTIVPATTVRTQQVQATEPSWITRLTPEMKAAILRRGFPLLTLPLILGPAALDSIRQNQSRDQLATPPPTPPAR